MAKTCCICDREFGENEAYLSIEIPYGNHGRMVELTYCEHSLPCQLKTLAVAEKYKYLLDSHTELFNHLRHCFQKEYGDKYTDEIDKEVEAMYFLSIPLLSLAPIDEDNSLAVMALNAIDKNVVDMIEEAEKGEKQGKKAQ